LTFSIGREHPALISCRGWDIAPLLAAAIQRSRLHRDASFQHYVAGVDAALQYAFTAPKPENIQEVLEGALSKGPDELLVTYRKYMSDPTHKFLGDSESRVNTLGYKLMSANRLHEAILIFELNVRTHSNSANAYDSLGEAYLKAQDKQRALDAYRKSVELNPKNTNATQVIKFDRIAGTSDI
jgi:tetratricopeptide (TPR) repeat protein